MLDRKKERIFRVMSSADRDTLIRLIEDMDGVSEVRKVRNNTLSFKATGKAYDAILSHVSGRIFKGLVSVQEVHLGRQGWGLDDHENVVERSER